MEVPFRDELVQIIQVGHLLNEKDEPILRYTHSIGTVRARYRMTLQWTNDPTPYVFDVILENELDIRPESEPARKLWNQNNDQKELFVQAIDFIYQNSVKSQ